LVGFAEHGSPLVSLVMTVWKPRPDWFLEAVRSALGQRGCHLELVVIDDGSPDPVESLLQGIHDPRMRVVRVPHGGLSHARNAGVEAARGDRVRFIDGDDILEPESTARLLSLIGSDDDVFSYGASLVCDEELRPVWKLASSRQGDVEVASLLGRFTVRPHTLMFPRRVLERTGRWDESFDAAEDWDFITRVAEHARARGERRVATYYRRHGASFTGNVASSMERAERSARKVVDHYFQRHPGKRGTRLERLAEARLHAIAARRHLTQGQRKEALRRCRHAFRLDPRAVGHELAQATPVLWGYLRYGQLSPLARSALPWARPAQS
jgi:glycosyltransferase involved in cell wall biosynthesis